MAVEQAADRAAFTNPDEFGVIAILGGKNITGIPDTFANVERPAANSRSSVNPYMVQAVDISTNIIQFLTEWKNAKTAVMGDTLSITDGDYAGDYEICDIQRDGEFCRLILNIA